MTASVCNSHLTPPTSTNNGRIVRSQRVLAEYGLTPSFGRRNHGRKRQQAKTTARPIPSTARQVAVAGGCPATSVHPTPLAFRCRSQCRIAGYRPHIGRRYRLAAETIAGTPINHPITPSPNAGTPFSSHSATIIASIRMPLYTRQPCSYKAQWLEAYIPNNGAYPSPNNSTSCPGTAKERTTKCRRAPTHEKSI